ncbi:Protein MAIN-LIKE 1 [Glycine soja]
MLVCPTLFFPHVPSSFRDVSSSPSSFRDCCSSSSSSERSSTVDGVVVVAHSSSTLLMRVLLRHLDFARSSSLLVLLHRGLLTEVWGERIVMILTVLPSIEGLPHRHGGNRYFSLLPMMCLVPADEKMVDAEAQDTGAEVAADEAEGFPGGSSDSSVLTEYAKHVATNIWFGEERPELKLSSHGRKVHKLGRPVPAIEEMVVGTGLSPLIVCSVDTSDRGLISLFVERWHRETSTFHLPMGEVSIMLDDLTSLLHLPIVGDFRAFQPLHIDETVLMLVELLMVSLEVAMAETGHCNGPYVRLSWLRDIYQRRCQTQHWTAAARAYLLHLLGCTLFANKSATHVHVVFLDALRDLTQTRRYAWGAAGLVHMYDHLNDASIGTNRYVAGYIMLLQCNADSEYDEVSLYACRWIATKKIVKKISTATYKQRLDHLRIPDVCWMPYAEHRPVQDFHPISCFSRQLRWGPVVVRYRPETVMRQFGYVQCIPAHPVDSWVSFDDVDDRWTHYSDHLALTSNPPRDAFAAQPRHIPQEPAPGSTHADSDADEPRHAVEACHAIAETLEHHLSLNEVTLGTLTHEVIQKCLRIARGVTEDRNVYVRSRRRRRTDQP